MEKNDDSHQAIEIICETVDQSAKNSPQDSNLSDSRQ